MIFFRLLGPVNSSFVSHAMCGPGEVGFFNPDVE